MITEFNEFLNEGVHVLSVDKLRDSLKDIIMTRVEKNGFILVKDVVKILKEEYNINISEEILDSILDSWDKKDYSIFSKKDKNWLDYFSFRKEIKRSSKHNTAVFGKGRKKSDIKPYTTGNYTTTNTSRNYKRWNNLY